MAKILMVIGSQRTNGFQLQLAHAIEKQIGDRAEVTYLDYSDVPFINQDIEFPAPAGVEAARKAFQEADGVWFVTPVYNHTTSPQTVNLLDWISRPLEPNVRETAVSNGVKGYLLFRFCAGCMERYVPRCSQACTPDWHGRYG